MAGAGCSDSVVFGFKLWDVGEHGGTRFFSCRNAPQWQRQLQIFGPELYIIQWPRDVSPYTGCQTDRDVCTTPNHEP